MSNTGDHKGRPYDAVAPSAYSPTKDSPYTRHPTPAHAVGLLVAVHLAAVTGRENRE